MENTTGPESGSQEPKWQPLTALERRVVGVLVEKAKTTPDAYPMSLNALTNGCNQKSNRHPQMDVESDDVEEALEGLREKGAVGEVHGGGRVARYRHYLKDWLAVDGTELAVMAELLLRGDQTVGELRGRAARMAAGQLPDLGALRPVLQSLIEKQLVLELTPPGRGQLVTHNLHLESERAAAPQPPAAHPGPRRPAPPPDPAVPASPTPGPTAHPETGLIAELRRELDQLRDEVGHLRKEVEDIWASLK
jgi:uncharacterized protein YceH (UPF0502 family)